VVMPALRWLEKRLAAQGTTADEIVRIEHQRQAAMNVTVRNVITSMRLVSSFDWAEFFESVSLVDATLWTETDFAAPDFATRDRYRHAIEELSRFSPHNELEVARRAVSRAKRFLSETQETGNPLEDRRADPGYYLISRGRIDFEQELGFRVPLRNRLIRAYITDAASRYLGTIAFVTGLILAPFVVYSGAMEVGVAALLLVGLLGLFPASDLAIALVNREVTMLLKPRPLPRLALREGVPAELRTLVVVPTLLVGHNEIAEQIEQLEVHYLANPDSNLFFALLSDWIDAPQETMPDDDELLAAATDGIARLNRRHGPAADGGGRFLLFHRRRRWNESEGKWIGWERKRGKLHELNRLLRGAPAESYMQISVPSRMVG
jgi:cyclic beta-1,2-glucan synthetase